MKVLFYIRQEKGQERVVTKHPEYVPAYLADEEDAAVTAFFEAPFARTQTPIEQRFDKIIEGLKKTLPYVQVTMEFVDRASASSEGGDIHTYLRCVEVPGMMHGVRCAFATFERFDVKSPVLKEIFELIAAGHSTSEAILNFGEAKLMWL